MGLFTGMVDWTKAAFLPLGYVGLFILAFMESSFFPIPPDILVIILTLAKPENFMFYALVATVGSVLGGMFGYWIGLKGGLPLLKRFFKETKIKKVHNLFNRYEAWAIFIAGFTPIPYKIFTIAGGVFYINFKKFILASIVSRGLRYYLIASLVGYFGQAMVDVIDKYFDLITLIVIVAVGIGYIILKKSPWKKK